MARLVSFLAVFLIPLTASRCREPVTSNRWVRGRKERVLYELKPRPAMPRALFLKTATSDPRMAMA